LKHGVILSGGLGRRFWPISRAKRPKQLLNLFSKKTLVEDTVDRIYDLVDDNNIHIVLQPSLAKIMPDSLKETVNFIEEPGRRNTAPAIGLAAKKIMEEDPDATLFVFPSDHIIRPREAFVKVLRAAGQIVEEKPSNICLVGIPPSRPEVGYGYIEINPAEAKKKGEVSFYRVKAFKEKPSRLLAQEFYLSGHYFWNAGIFVWKAQTLLELIKEFLPELYKTLEIMSSNPKKFKRKYKSLTATSIDYGVLEKVSDRIRVIKGDFFWDDVGSWHSLKRILPRDKNNNVIVGQGLAIDSYESTIVNEHGGLIVCFGVSDVVVARHANVVLVLHKTKIEEMRGLVDTIKEDPKLKRYL